MSKLQGQFQAIEHAKATLADIDVMQRCEMLGVGKSESGRVKIYAFGCDYILNPNTLDLTIASSGQPASPGDQILILHYLLCDVPIEEAGKLITFRDMPGGQFYWDPFLSRSIKPLLKRIGNNIDILKTNLNRFWWQPFEAGDFAAKIHAIGKIYAYLVYHIGDEEFPAAAEMLFDFSIKRIYGSEDVAFIASRICIELVQHKNS